MFLIESHSLASLGPCIFVRLAQSAQGVEYTNCIFAEGYNSRNKCPDYDIKPSHGETLALKIWRMLNTPSMPLLQGPLWPGVVAPDRVLSMGQKEVW